MIARYVAIAATVVLLAADSYDQALDVARGALEMMGPGARIEIREMSSP